MAQKQLIDQNFENRVRELVALTRPCSIAKILTIRNMTLSNIASQDWASGNQLRTIFNVVLTAKLQSMGEEMVHAAQRDSYEHLLPLLSAHYSSDQREGDRETLANTTIQALAGLFQAAVQRSTDPKFEGKVHELLLNTRASSIAQILALRQEIMTDPATRVWATNIQIKVIFNVALTSKLQGMGDLLLREAQVTDYEGLLARESSTYTKEQRESDREILANSAIQAFASLVYESMAPTITVGSAAYWESGVTAAPTPAPTPAPTAAPTAVPKVEGLRRTPPTAPRPTPALVVANAAPVKVAATKGESRPEVAPVAPPRAPAKPTAAVDFAKLFDDTIYNHLMRPLGLLQVTGQSEKGMPFILAPSFADFFGVLLRTFVLPNMRGTRTIRTMSESHNWGEVGGAALIEIIQSGEQNNPILHTWDARWQELKSAPAPVKAAVPEKKGGLFSKAQPAVVVDKESAATQMWRQISEHAKKHGYLPPASRDISVFEVLIRMRPEALVKALTEMQHLYNQEFLPAKASEQGREGSFRDCLNKWSDRLPPFIGEFLVVRSLYVYSKCDLTFLQNFSKSHGKTVQERQRAIPHIMEFISGMDPSA